MHNYTAQIHFFGGTDNVTGANFLLTYGDKKILIDCGMIQGSPEQELRNYEDFPYDPADIDVLLVTHAHQDHIGRIPKLVQDGFAGTIYSTAATKEISAVMLDDAADILAFEATKEGRDPLYEKKYIEQALALWKVIPYHNTLEFLPGISMILRDAGHVLGSAMIEIHIEGKKILFTGDLGNSPSPLLHDIENVQDIDYIIMESVYGDRNHGDRTNRSHELEMVIKETIFNNGVLMIPVFSLERTQEILFELNDMVEHKRIPPVPIYLDSPLAERVTRIYEKSTEFFKPETRKIINSGDNVFDFPGLRISATKEDSQAINDVAPPKIILAGSGMMNGGRIIHHALRYLEDEKNTLLFVGFQAPGTLGSSIQSGAGKVRIYREDVRVRARIHSIPAYSGHAGADELVDFVRQTKDTLRAVYCVMGEPSSSQALARRIRDELGVYADAPHEGVVVDIPLK
ncbi:MAG: MBL fold metallo-hydrolase [Candidatus Pacebacteria bacterium]|nr:MBL fold metallo-hydrolase [Candidatus Paceibacterota bacterium]MCD8563795.1 MBL fold metallo-hydrolase [Candidatus Paceibacterota bacterium]